MYVVATDSLDDEDGGSDGSDGDGEVAGGSGEGEVGPLEALTLVDKHLNKIRQRVRTRGCVVILL